MSDIINAIVPIEAIQPHPRNYKVHPPTQIAKLKSLHKRFTQYRSVVIWQRPNNEYVQVAGHGIVEAMKERGVTHVRADILPEDTPEEDIEGILIADNNLPLGAVDNEELLAMLLQEQQDAGYDLASLGSDDEALRQMLESLGDGYLGSDSREDGAGGDEFDTTPEEGPTRTHVGELWKLGEHRLLVGDSTKAENVAKLMQGDKASLVVTSPPYWVGREYEQEHGQSEIVAHIQGAAYSMVLATADVAHIAINTGTTTETKQGGLVRRVWLLLDWWASAFERYGWNMRNVRIWAKHGGFTTFTPQQDLVDQNWEFLASFTRDKPKHQNKVGERWALDGIWDCQPQTANIGHSAPFPVEIPHRYITLYTDKEDTVFDPYGGSGTTLIACERTNRHARLCEIEPKYADVILKRYEAETNRQAQLLERVEVPSHA